MKSFFAALVAVAIALTLQTSPAFAKQVSAETCAPNIFLGVRLPRGTKTAILVYKKGRRVQKVRLYPKKNGDTMFPPLSRKGIFRGEVHLIKVEYSGGEVVFHPNGKAMHNVMRDTAKRGLCFADDAYHAAAITPHN